MMHKIAHAKRLVVKVGSSLLIDPNTRAINHTWLASLIEDILACYAQQQEVILVSSGAIALGRNHLGIDSKPLLLAEKQAYAAIGQIQLAHAYQSLLAKAGRAIGQVLLTIDDNENPQRYVNAQNTLSTLLALGILPVINENDTVATAEIRFGDNDRLAACVAQMVKADVLILLSDVDGLYTADPTTDQEAQHIPEVHNLDNTIINMGGHSKSEYGSGGMITKLQAAKITMASGCKMVIAAGKPTNPLAQIDHAERKTWFVPPHSHLQTLPSPQLQDFLTEKRSHG
jgi:glutamate 5-kinase